jgi:hypothetical protein
MNDIKTLPKGGSFVIESYSEKLDQYYQNRNRYWFRELILTGEESKLVRERKIKYATHWKYK